jgi:hypothetical protein
MLLGVGSDQQNTRDTSKNKTFIILCAVSSVRFLPSAVCCLDWTLDNKHDKS